MLLEGESNDQNQDDKTEDPSERRLEKSYEEGKTFISRELNNWAIVGTSLIVILLIFPFSIKHLMKLLTSFFSYTHGFEITHETTYEIFFSLSTKVALTVIFPLLTYNAVVFLVGLMQSYKAITVKKLMPKLSNISLKKGLKKIFSKDSVIELIKSCLKIIVISTAIYFIFKNETINFHQWMWLNWSHFISVLMHLIFKLIFIIFIILTVIAAFDYFYQRYIFMKQMRMSHQDIKEERKEQEGDPLIRQKIKQAQQERSKQSVKKAIENATVVITNPTHFAVALHWDPKSMHAPQVVAKGQDFIAQTIRELAKEFKIPIVENPPLARALFNNIKIDHTITPEHYQAVADVIKLVGRMKNNRF